MSCSNVILFAGSIPTTLEGDKSNNDANDVPTNSGKKSTGAFSGLLALQLVKNKYL